MSFCRRKKRTASTVAHVRDKSDTVISQVLDEMNSEKDSMWK